MFGMFKTPSPAMGVALIALFVALSGTATAVTVATVPLAKRALVADNAKKVGGQTSAALMAKAAQDSRAAVATAAASPGPASTAAGLVTWRSIAAGSLQRGEGRAFTVACDAGQRIMGAGWSTEGAIVALESFPQSDTTWYLWLSNESGGTVGVSLYASCLK